VPARAYRRSPVSRCYPAEIKSARSTIKGKGGKCMGILWIILIVILVLALLGFFSRGYW
jgi:flagellar basal body-associated protein FliL